MKTVSVMTVRKSLGRILDEVNLKSETFILERGGKPIARIVPLNSSDSGHSDSNPLNLKALEDLKALNPHTERGRNPGDWLEDERSSWD